MELNKNIGFPYDNTSYHNHSNTIKTTRQNVTLRRRCRSECLQVAPLYGTQIDNPTNLKYSELYSSKHFSRTNFIKHKSPPLSESKRVYPNTVAVERRLNGINKDHIKENIRATSINCIDSNPLKLHDITDIRETYINDLDQYKDRGKPYNFLNSINNRFSNSGDTNCNSIDKYIDTNKRRIRTRSESEPHEIYNTKYLQANGNERNRVVEIVKRARDDGIHPKYLQNGYMNYSDDSINERQTASPPPPTIVNLHYTEILNNHLIKSNSKLVTTKTNIMNSIMRNKMKRSPTPTLKTTVTPPKTPLRKNSISPPPISVTPSQVSQTTNTTTTKSSTQEHEDSDEECSSLDDDDDFGEIGEVDDADITDDEEIRTKHLLHNEPCDNGISPSAISSECVVGRYSTCAPLAPSLFPNCPPYITFASHLEKGPQMPSQLQRILKWKLTTITPIVVRKVLINSGFKLLKKTNDWMGIWGKHMKSPCFKTIRSYQKINHIPGTFQIGRKDRVWRNMQIQMSKHGKREFNFMPRTYIIPQDIRLLRQAWPKYQQRNTKWIIKPPAAARGTGIKVVNRWSQIPKKRPLIVQKYIERPLLINGSKFDLRLYVLVTSINPLRIYLHTDGLARFASVKYSEKTDTLNDRYMHLTNYSINKFSSNYAKNEDANACKGHKWTVKSLWSYLEAQGINTTRLWGALRNLVLRTILVGEGPIYAMTKINTNNKYNTYELFGIDVILDSELIPWLLEVNISPSLHSASPLDMHVKGPLVRAALNTALYQVPPKLTNLEQIDVLTEQRLKGPLCFDRRIFSIQLSEAERIKHSFYANKALTNRDDYISSILDNLTPDDIRCLIITEDELARCAPLERIFPAPYTHKYLNFTDSPRYYNRLLDAWENRYGGKRRDEGIYILQKLCESDKHLIVPPVTLRKDSNNEDETLEKNGVTKNSKKMVTITKDETAKIVVGNKTNTEEKIKSIADAINNIAVIQAQ